MKTLIAFLLILLNPIFTFAITPRSPITGAKQVTVVLINSTDFQQRCTASDEQQLYYLAQRNIQGYFETVSYGMFTYQNARVLQTNLSYPTKDGCDYLRYSKDARTALKLPSRPSGAVVYILPTNSCPFTGQAQVASGNGNAWIIGDTCDLFDLHLHQLGHINGFQHADIDYDNDGISDVGEGDLSDPMGYTAVGIKHFNAAHKYQAGWIMAKIAPSKGEGTYSLTNFETTGEIIIYPRDSKNNYFVSYRAGGDPYSIGLDGDFNRRVSIHWTGTSRTYLITTLGVGETWSDGAGGFVRFNFEDGNVANVTVRR